MKPGTKIVLKTLAVSSLFLIEYLLRERGRQAVHNQIREIAPNQDKPILNVGAGCIDLGPNTVNCDKFQTVNGYNRIEAMCPCKKDKIEYCDLEKLAYPDKQFSIAVASHVLEHTDNPKQALSELQRVSDKQIILTPKPWDISSYFIPTHKYVFTDPYKAEGVRIYPYVNIAIGSALFIWWIHKDVKELLKKN